VAFLESTLALLAETEKEGCEMAPQKVANWITTDVFKLLVRADDGSYVEITQDLCREFRKCALRLILK